MKSYQNKTFIVTGGASGIGRGLAIQLLKRGASIAIADLDEAGLAETKALALRSAASNVKVSTHKLDVASLEGWRTFRTAVLEEHGKIDGLINNAGVGMDVKADEMTYEELDWVMNINFYGMVYGSTEFLEHLKGRPEAVIANVSSIFGIFGAPGYAAYNASKFAIRGYTDALRLDLHDTHVQVNSIIPGHIGTNIAHNHRVPKSRENKERTGSLSKTMQDNFKEKGMDPLIAADIILKGILKDKRYIFIGKDAKAIDILNRATPDLFVKSAAKLIRKLINSEGASIV